MSRCQGTNLCKFDYINDTSTATMLKQNIYLCSFRYLNKLKILNTQKKGNQNDRL